MPRVIAPSTQGAGGGVDGFETTVPFTSSQIGYNAPRRWKKAGRITYVEIMDPAKQCRVEVRRASDAARQAGGYDAGVSITGTAQLSLDGSDWGEADLSTWSTIFAAGDWLILKLLEAQPDSQVYVYLEVAYQ